MTRKKALPSWLDNLELPDEEYAALFSHVSHDELALFAAKICKRVVALGVGGGYMETPPTVGASAISEPLLLRTLAGLDKSVYGKQASRNAKPGKPRLVHAWQAVKNLHDQHRSTKATRAAFVNFVMNQLAGSSDCPGSSRTIDSWVKAMDEQQSAR